MGRHLSPQYGQVILVSGYLVWQLSIDHNIDIQYVYQFCCAPIPNSLESVRLSIDRDLVKQLTGQRKASK